MTTSPLFKRPLRNGWFSMESAPRTGETIMLYESGRGVFEGWWKQTEYEAYWMDLQDSEPDPVAWRPILPGPHEVVAASHEPPAEEVETGWQPIETAPTGDDDFFLVCGAGDDRPPFVVRGAILKSARQTNTPSHLHLHWLTHWMPLPGKPGARR